MLDDRVGEKSDALHPETVTKVRSVADTCAAVLLEKIPMRINENDSIVFESVGMSLWDTTATAWAYHWALKQKAGTPFSLA